ncbi:MAG: hydantoinase B/oxoprolinase family protein [Cyanobacteriota bacterium]|nr:hydantoinase B/oxoprolinase family protein [Cyanobacteriota bacterium]
MTAFGIPSPNPIQTEVMASALAGIAEEMGARLIQASYSSNIKERRDCSTALFDGGGRLLAQAAHIPVHLGALAEAVQAVMACQPQPGDSYLLNDPFHGGSHLPDLTLVTAMGSLADPERVVAFAVNRAHHADVGGMRPGSMPADSTDIWQEGLVIPPIRLARWRQGEPEWDPMVLRLILANVRRPEQRRGDLLAQLGANRVGFQRFHELLRQQGEATVWQRIQQVIDSSEQRMRACIEALPDGEYAATDYLEPDDWNPQGIRLQVVVRVKGSDLEVDFSGTEAAVVNNLNAPLAVTRSAVLFALRCLLDPTAPSNGGSERPLHIHVPVGCLLNAQFPAAVVAGNVETSQRVADLLLTALSPVAGERAMAQGQGTMNNVILGNAHFTYYETLGGGQGASQRGPGLDGVHVGMSNTLNTPIESLELEYPLRVIAYQLRSDSGGAGQQRGGWGLTRSLQILENCTLSLLTERRRFAPQGLAQGSPGQVGQNLVNGQPIAGKTSCRLRAGDMLTLHTPGGGGFGDAEVGTVNVVSTTES